MTHSILARRARKSALNALKSRIESAHDAAHEAIDLLTQHGIDGPELRAIDYVLSNLQSARENLAEAMPKKPSAN